MSTTHIIIGETRHALVARAGARHAVCDRECPRCGVEPLCVSGRAMRPSDDDLAWEADGHCIACREHVGLIRHEPDTLFGVREDETVLHGRARVYG